MRTNTILRMIRELKDDLNYYEKKGNRHKAGEIKKEIKDLELILQETNPHIKFKKTHWI